MPNKKPQVMIILTLFTIIAAVALPFVLATTIHVTRTTVLTLVITAALLVPSLVDQLALDDSLLFSSLVQVSPTTAALEVLLCLGGGIALCGWAATTPLNAGSEASTGGTVSTAVPTISTYPLFVCFTVAGGSLLLSACDLITLYLAVELQSFALYVIAALYRDSIRATEAGLMYFMLGGLSSTLILLGSGLIYATTGLTSLQGVAMMLPFASDGAVAASWSATLGFVILTAGLLFKVTAAPFHNWGPDVYDGVPTIVTTWLAVLPKVSLMALLLVLSVSFGGQNGLTVSGHDLWSAMLLVSSMLSLIVGTVVGLAQTRIKRLLAYSTISHVGFLLLALTVHSSAGAEAFIFYMAQYTLTALTSFLCLLAFGYVMSTPRSRSTDVVYIDQLTNQFTAHPLLGLTLAVCLFSMAGVPPLVGFFGKMTVLSAAVADGNVFLAVIAVVTSVISASYYLRIIRVVYFSADSQAQVIDGEQLALTNLHAYLLAALTLGLAGFLATPDLVLNSSRLLALALYGLTI